MVHNSSIPFNPELKDVNRGSEIVILTTVFTVLVVLGTATRIGTKLWMRIHLLIEDYLIILSLVKRCNLLLPEVMLTFTGTELDM